MLSATRLAAPLSQRSDIGPILICRSVKHPKVGESGRASHRTSGHSVGHSGQTQFTLRTLLQTIPHLYCVLAHAEMGRKGGSGEVLALWGLGGAWD